MYVCPCRIRFIQSRKKIRDLQMYSNDLLTGFDGNIHFVIPEN